MTKTKHRGQAEAAGPFVIRRRRKAGQQLAGRVLYKQRRGGWSSDPEAAWKFDTEQAAKFVLRGNEGEVVAVEDLDGARPDGLARVPQAGRTAGQAECEPGVFDVAPTATAGAVVLSGKLNESDQELKRKCEDTIRGGLDYFVDVGRALVTIRDRRLYREEFATFDAYMKSEWGLSARHGHRLCDAAEVMQNLLPAPGSSDQLVTLPKTESQARELARLPAAEQRPAWEEARAQAPNGKVTASHVQEAVSKRIAKKSNSGNGSELDNMPKAPPYGPQKRERILVASSHALRAIRSLEDLCEPNHMFVLACTSARGEIESLEREIKRWCVNSPGAESKPTKQWVVCRVAMRGSTTSSGKVRYRGQHADWTLDPQKVTPFPTLQEAKARAKDDRVVLLDRAIRRFVHQL